MGNGGLTEQLLARLTELEARTARAEEGMAQAKAEAAEAKASAAQLAARQQELDTLANRPEIEERPLLVLSEGAGRGQDVAAPDREPRRFSRKGLVKAAAASAAALAATSLVVPERAAAADGQPIIIGSANSGTNSTSLTATGAPLLEGAFKGIGRANGEGVVGEASGDEGYGLYGVSSTGYGVFGESSTGIALFAGDNGRFGQALGTVAGPPTSGSFLAGEQIRDSRGDLYICVTGGSPGIWQKVVALRAGFAAAGAVYYLPVPVRLLDTRESAPIAGGTSITLPVGGAGGIPADARGVLGNITAIQAVADGFLTLYPTGEPRPLASSNNYAAGAIVNTLAMSRLSTTTGATGRMQIFANVTTHVTFDAVAFVV